MESGIVTKVRDYTPYLEKVGQWLEDFGYTVHLDQEGYLTGHRARYGVNGGFQIRMNTVSELYCDDRDVVSNLYSALTRNLRFSVDKINLVREREIIKLCSDHIMHRTETIPVSKMRKYCNIDDRLTEEEDTEINEAFERIQDHEPIPDNVVYLRRRAA